MSHVRAFRREDWVGSVILCPCCNRMLPVIEAQGPFPGVGARGVDQWWLLTFSDDSQARMWEDHKGVVVYDENDPRRTRRDN